MSMFYQMLSGERGRIGFLFPSRPLSSVYVQSVLKVQLLVRGRGSGVERGVEYQTRSHAGSMVWEPESRMRRVYSAQHQVLLLEACIVQAFPTPYSCVYDSAPREVYSNKTYR